MKSSADMAAAFPVRADDDVTRTNSPGSRNGSGLSNTPFTMLNTAVVAPIARASVATATTVKPVFR
jgi:hypothetical protein